VNPLPSRLPGGVGLSRLHVYDAPSPDGQCGGSPHVHLACEELYYVIGGAGAVEFLTADQGFERVPLEAGQAIRYGPGVVHRLVNEGNLEILVVMQNAGLPELGDTVFTFPSSDLDDSSRYTRLVRAKDAREATARRDRAVEGFTVLRRAFERSHVEGGRLLTEFLVRAAELVRTHIDVWTARVEEGPTDSTRVTFERLAALRDGDSRFLFESSIETFDEARSMGDYQAGICGLRWPIPPHPAANS
jgi:mannose-6-phosphate isomerase-like protein (cupin superfamily)